MVNPPQRIAIIGAGRVTSQLAPWLQGRGVEIAQIYNRTFAHAEALATALKSEPVASLKDIDPEVEMIIIAVSDDAIAGVSAQLPQTDAVVVHTSGTRSMADVAQHKQHGVFYPLQTFSGEHAVDFARVPFCIEASSAKVEELLAACCVLWGIRSYAIDSKQREILHVAAVIANNFTNHLWGKSFDLLRKNEIEPDILYPLILETVRRATQGNPHEVQTGPAMRGDKNTIDRHLQKLSETPELQEIYTLITQSIFETKKTCRTISRSSGR